MIVDLFQLKEPPVSVQIKYIRVRILGTRKQVTQSHNDHQLSHSRSDPQKELLACLINFWVYNFFIMGDGILGKEFANESDVCLCFRGDNFFV